MRDLIVYSILAVTGLVTGYAAHQLSKWVRSRGPISRRVLLGRFADNLFIFPGVFLIFAFLPPSDRLNLLDMLALGGAFFAPHYAARIALVSLQSSGAHFHERQLAYEHWYSLLQQDPARANDFITTYFASGNPPPVIPGAPPDHRQSVSDRRVLLRSRLSELRDASAYLQQRFSRDALLHQAQTILGTEIDRLQREEAGWRGPGGTT
jgi:hypothetical protein